MKRKLLTRNQTNILYSILDEMETRCGYKITVTEFLNSILQDTILFSMAARIKIIRNKKTQEETYARLKKELKVFKGTVYSNGLPYTVIVGVKNKIELRDLLNLTTVQSNQWKLSTTPLHLNVVIEAPGKFFKFPESKRGRPSKENYTILTNVLPAGGHQ